MSKHIFKVVLATICVFFIYRAADAKENNIPSTFYINGCPVRSFFENYLEKVLGKYEASDADRKKIVAKIIEDLTKKNERYKCLHQFDWDGLIESGAL